VFVMDRLNSWFVVYFFVVLWKSFDTFTCVVLWTKTCPGDRYTTVAGSPVWNMSSALLFLADNYGHLLRADCSFEACFGMCYQF